MSAALLFIGVALAAIAGLTASILAVLALAGRGHPPALSLVLWLLPAIVVVPGARWVTEQAVIRQLRMNHLMDWAPGVAEVTVPLWQSVAWVGLAMSALAVLPVLLAAIAGALRGPRRPWLAGAVLLWTLAGAGLSAALLYGTLTGSLSPPLSSWLTPLSLLLFGSLVSVASLAGGERSGSSAADVAASSAAAVVLGQALFVLTSNQAEVIQAVAAAPVEMAPTLLMSGQSGVAVYSIAHGIAAVTAAGWIALALGARRSAASQGVTPLGAAVAMIALPLIVLGCPIGDLLALPGQARATLPIADIPSDVQIPLATGMDLYRGDRHRGLERGLGALVLAVDGPRWARSGAAALYLESLPDGDYLDEVWPLPGAVPTVVDARLPTGQALDALAASARDAARPWIVVQAPYRHDEAREGDWARLPLAPPGPGFKADLVIDAALLGPAGCFESPCTREQLDRALGEDNAGLRGVDDALAVDPRVAFGTLSEIIGRIDPSDTVQVQLIEVVPEALPAPEE